MNVAMLLTPKSEVKHIDLTSTLRQAMETMQHNKYTSVPVISDAGKYAGTLTEGDLLWTLKTESSFDDSKISSVLIEDIVMKIYNEPVHINVDIKTIIKRSVNQNFIPVVDDNNIFIGIVKRGDIISYCMKEIGENNQNIDIMTKKDKVIYVGETTPIEKALEIMQKYRYSAIPVLDVKGRYYETLTEGEILWALKTDKGIDSEKLYNSKLIDIARTVINKAKHGYDFETIVELLKCQNFVPIVDKNDMFVGIVKRSDLILYFLKMMEKKGDKNEK